MLDSLSSIRPLAALVLVLASAGCSERQIEPDYSEYIADVCAASCPVTTECVDDPFYSSTQECISMCSTSETWDELNQCRSRSLELSLCISELSCEGYQAYLMATLEAAPGFPPEGSPCSDELIAFYQCDPDLPFDPPE